MKYNEKGYMILDNGDKFICHSNHCNSIGEIKKGEECVVLNSTEDNFYTIRSLESFVTIEGAILGGLDGKLEMTYDAYLLRKPKKVNGIYETKPLLERKPLLNPCCRFIANKALFDSNGLIETGEECEILAVTPNKLYTYWVVSLKSGLVIIDVKVDTDKVKITYNGNYSKFYHNEIPKHKKDNLIAGEMVKLMFTQKERREVV